jgi:HAD superfamily hydrolase (TIGR01549 family)
VLLDLDDTLFDHQHCAREALVRDLATRTATAYRTGYIQARRSVPGARPFLETIRQRATVVIVSNNLLHEQQEKLRDCRLDGYIDVLVVSEEVGVSKPDARIFEIALERAGAGPQEAVMIGDSWANDVEGARSAGIRAVWFNRDGRPSPDPAVPVLRSLEISPETLRLIFGDEPPRREPD